MSDKSSFETVLKWIVVAIVVVVALKVVLIALALGGFLLFRLLPLILLVWIVYKVVKWLGNSNGNGSSPTTV